MRRNPSGLVSDLALIGAAWKTLLQPGSPSGKGPVPTSPHAGTIHACSMICRPSSCFACDHFTPRLWGVHPARLRRPRWKNHFMSSDGCDDFRLRLCSVCVLHDSAPPHRGARDVRHAEPPPSPSPQRIRRFGGHGATRRKQQRPGTAKAGRSTTSPKIATTDPNFRQPGRPR